MSERLRSLGLDVGTTTTQLIFSELEVENRAGTFSVPELEITDRRILYRSPVYMTPLLRGELVDTEALRRIVDEAYARAGIQKGCVDTGAIIITGETSRKENARAVLEELSGYAGEFVVAAAGPHLESVLSAKGAGAPALSERTGKPVLHMDIGGGTSNLTLAEDGKIKTTGCLNVGGRLLKFDDAGVITYISPVLQDICPLHVGEMPTQNEIRELADTLVHALEMAAGLREATPLLARLWTKEAGAWSVLHSPGREMILSFSGGVADCIEKQHPPLAFGDMGPVLGKAIRESLLCRGEYRLGAETIRATVIGAGCYSAQLSGSTVFHRNVPFPLKNLPVISVTVPEADTIRAALEALDGPGMLALKDMKTADYRSLAACADAIMKGFGARPVYVCLEQDVAKALGQAIALRLPPDHSVLCMDRIRTGPESYLDVAAPVGPAIPVVIKTLILER